jgi:hypothetical protein
VSLSASSFCLLGPYNILHNPKNPRFINEILRFLMKRVHTGPLTAVYLCEFHEHTTDAEKAACKDRDRQWTEIHED